MNPNHITRGLHYRLDSVQFKIGINMFFDTVLNNTSSNLNFHAFNKSVTLSVIHYVHTYNIFKLLSKMGTYISFLLCQWFK